MIVSALFFAIAILGLFTRHGVLAYVCFWISRLIFFPTCYIWIRKKAGI